MRTLRQNLFLLLNLLFMSTSLFAQEKNDESEMKLVREFEGGKLYEANGFLIPVISGSNFEMGKQYGFLMVNEMKKVRDAILVKEVEAGYLDDETKAIWVNRAYESGSLRTKQFYEGVAEGTGWTLEDVVMLDQIMEFGIYQSKLHSFAGCTSIASWGENSKDGNMYIGRNMDWSPAFTKFPTVLTVRKPNDGSYQFATTGWAGMYAAFTAMNEKGVYLDLHDGTSMGGSVVAIDRPSLLNTLVDMMSETSTLEGLESRYNGMVASTSAIYTIADKNGAASVESSSLNGNRVRKPAQNNDALVVVNSFMEESWGLGKRETVSNSLRRFSNMTDRLAENKGNIDAQKTKDLMDLRLFNEDDSFKENGGCTKPALQDADLTVYQTVFDINEQKVYLKVPVPEYFADWTMIDLKELFND
ncbi:C45 family autoproteolytic acyltransferase/hydolase [Sediminitomix flava]|uniref:Acyl-CoA:6-aminopenicillanic acid acyl transferase n=1 Tax=Sediminitomix flava TaxID=379075 RepID=A0A315Z6C9_SEDFL|nr:C45 family peptidase [Sediminitomix flava]PWJ38530.1 acyl-CoA:6-aminopenicillanic acid acyl transferase [Sediminitomix flava]